MQKIIHYSLLDIIVVHSSISALRGVGGGAVTNTYEFMKCTCNISQEFVTFAFCDITFSAGPISLRIFNI